MTMLFFVAVYVLVVMLHVFVNGHTQVDTNASPRSAHKQNQISDPPEHQRQDKRPYTPPSRHVRLSRGPSFGSSIHMPPQSNRNPTTTNAGEATTRPLSPPAPPLPQNDHFLEGDLNRDTSHHHGERELTHLASSPLFSETFTNTHQHKAAKEVRKKVTTAYPERFQPRYHSESTDFGDRPVIIGICGGTGSGKTTLTNALYDRLGAEHVSCISHDSYYNDLQHLTLEERAHVNFDHPSSLDSNLMKDHINDLKEGKAIECPVYDFTTHSRKQDQTVRIEAKKIVLVDGILIFAEPKLLDLMDMKIFVDTADDIRLIRRLQRDTEERARTMNSVIEQYHKTVRPMHALYVEPSKGKADIIVPTCDGIQDVALDMILSRLKEIVGKEAYK